MTKTIELLLPELYNEVSLFYPLCITVLSYCKGHEK